MDNENIDRYRTTLKESYSAYAMVHREGENIQAIFRFIDSLNDEQLECIMVLLRSASTATAEMLANEVHGFVDAMVTLADPEIKTKRH